MEITKGEVFVPEQYYIITGELSDHTLTFGLNEKVDLTSYTATGNMLVDSDSLSFVYLLDGGEGYTYIRFQEEVWTMLANVLDQDVNVVVTSEDDTSIELTDLKEELSYLVENIKDNSNYGEVMNQAVEKVFLTAS
ncbi:hypothetical protein [Guptibacillus hwajinpoensis]|uniref:UPF0738 family protein n=1 Tax=Guptibacillus hwajinpoensis TaxID=208199 RepID=UPI00273D8862|nr:hypothetical protein [Pseudalkalibacillus hwajinpoensis]WLR59534.1 hypothetical protein LC071_20795 [Pseudalkalibacillus hwajinpoensis]